MRHTKALYHTILFMFIAILISLAPTVVRASEADEDDEYDVTARVVRTSLLRGEVNIKRAGSDEWETATLNLPLVEGDTLATTGAARLEIQIDARNYVRVEADSVLRIVTLRPEGIALSLIEGTITLRLTSFERDREYFEVDAPQTTIAVEKRGLYRLDVGRGAGSSVRVTALDGGQARIYSQTSGFTLRDGRSAQLVDAEPDEGDWQFTEAPSDDDWDMWVAEREHYLAERLRFEQRERYYDSDIWGAEELDAYGDWVYADAYQGWVWRPRASALSNYQDWAPYRYGNWRWCPPYGWTWVGDEPWGWAPFHYGRWVYYNNSWCWAPRGTGARTRRNWWRPALVAFVYIPTPRGEHVAWYPLGFGQHDPHRRNINLPAQQRPGRSRDWDERRRANSAYWRSVTWLPSREFGHRGARGQAAPADLGQRAVGAEPVLGRLPIAPDRGTQNNAGERGRRARTTQMPARPDSTLPPDTLTRRRTGAGRRMPGAALDDELWRTRIHPGRAPRVSVPAAAAEQQPNNGSEPGTGVVARPPARYPARPGFERDAGRGPRRMDRAPRDERSDRPVRTDEGRGGGAPSAAADTGAAPRVRERSPVDERERNPGGERERSPRGEHRPEQATPPVVVSPAAPTERPDRTERPARPERPERHNRPQPRPEPQATVEAAPVPTAAAGPSVAAPAQSDAPAHSGPRPERPRPESEQPAPRPEPQPRQETPQPAPPAPPAPAPNPPAPREEPQHSPPAEPPPAAAPPPAPPPAESKPEPKEPARPEQQPG